MYATRVLRQAAVHAERTPLIRFLGPRAIPCKCMQPHPLVSNVESEGHCALTRLFLSPQLQSTTLPSLTLPPPQASFPKISQLSTAAVMLLPPTTPSAPTVTTLSSTALSRRPLALMLALAAPLATSWALSSPPRALLSTIPSSLPASAASLST